MVDTLDLSRLNQMQGETLREELTRCCGAHRWVEAMMARHPFASEKELFEAAETLWFGLDEADWLEAFTHHPKIGDINSLRAKFAATRQWSAQEQSGVDEAEEVVLQGLAQGNAQYEQQNGFIFIVCATGKSAAEMLDLLQARLGNDRQTEMRNAAREQSKITRIRLEKLLS